MARRGKGTREPGFAAKAVHAGQHPDPTTGAVMQPIYHTSTYRQPSLGGGWKFDYARTVNPTRSALERAMAELEGGLEARCFASGMSAIHAVLALLRSGDHVVVSRSVYGGTYRLFEGLLRQFGLEFSWVETSNLEEVERAIRPNTRMLYVETPTNPVLTLTDLRGASRIARKRKLRFVVDNTFMSPYFQSPIALGADLVVHSTTKYLNGHSVYKELCWLRGDIRRCLDHAIGICVIEQVFKPNKLVYCAGQIHGILTSIPSVVHTVHPTIWRTSVFGTAKGYKKSWAVKFCQDFYPEVNLFRTDKSRVPDHNIAEAVCIAHYAKLQFS